MHINNKIATEDDVYDVVLASSSYLYTFWQTFSSSKSTNSPSTLLGSRRMLRRRDDLGRPKYARLVQKLRLGSDSFHRYFRMSTKQFDYVLGLVEPHILRLPRYVVVHVQGRTTSYAAVRRRTQCEVVNAALKRETNLKSYSWQCWYSVRGIHCIRERCVGRLDVCIRALERLHTQTTHLVNIE